VVRPYVAIAIVVASAIGIASATVAIAASGPVAMRPPSLGGSVLPAQVPDPANDPEHVMLSALRPSAGGAASDRSIVYRNGCHVKAQAPTPAHFCVYGDTTAKRTVVLIGDSHAAQWFPAFDRATRALNVRLVYLTRSACPGEAVSVRVRVYYRACDVWRQNAYALIKTLPRVDLLVIAGSAHHVLLQRQTHVLITSQSARAQEWASGIQRTVAALGAVAHDVVVMRDTPQMSRESGPCLIATNGDNGACGTAYGTASAAVIWQAERGAAQQYPTVGTADFTAAFCTPTQCRPVTSTGILRWRDRGHMTATFGPILTPLVEAMLGRALAGHLTN
jgi:hypothetical protein